MIPPEPPPPPSRSGFSVLFGVAVLVAAVWLARRPAIGWVVFGGLALAGLGVPVLRWSAARRDPAWERRPHRLRLRWMAAGASTLAVAGLAWRAPGAAAAAAAAFGVGAVGLALILSGWFALRHGQPTHSVKREPDQQWRSRVEAGWPTTARAAGLVHPDLPGQVAPLAGPVAAHGPAGLTLRVDLERVLLAPEDVQAAVPTLRRRLRADHVRVQPDGIDAVMLRAYRRHPLDVHVSWRDLRPVGVRPGESTPFAVDEAGRMAVLRWRLSTVIWGLPDAGKSMLIRSALAGMVVQGLPFRLWVWDNGGDFRPLSRIARRYTDESLAGLDLLRELSAHMDSRQSSGVLDSGGAHRPTLTDPADILVVGELLPAQQFRVPRGTRDAGTMRAEVGELLKRVPRDGRKLSTSLLTTAQTSLKDEIGPIRDLFAQRVAAKLWDASLVNPALGDGALERGGDAHLIPGALPGVAYQVDRRSGWPVMVRGADIPPAEIRTALVEPYEALMGPVLRVVDGGRGRG